MLFQVGDRFLNIALVREVTFDGEFTRLYYSAAVHDAIKIPGDLRADTAGLDAPCISIDPDVSTRASGMRASGFVEIPALHSASVLDQVAIYRAGVVGSEFGGLPDIHGGCADFVEIRKILDAAGVPGWEQNAVVARADRVVKQIIRDNLELAKTLVERLLVERTIRFTSPTAARAVTPVAKAKPIVLPATQIRRATMPLLARSIHGRSSFNAADNTLGVIFTTGEPVSRTDSHGSKYVEVLETGADNVDLSRLNAGASFLDNHKSDSLDHVLGSVVSARMENGRGLATIKLATRKEVAGAVMDLKDGIITGISCGYRYEKVAIDDSSDVPVWRVKRWQPYEISACLIQADSGARVRGGTHDFEIRG